MHNSVNFDKQNCLKGYNYSREGMYFITICTHNREHLFWEIVDEKILLKYAESCWCEIGDHLKNVKLHEFVVMPNHIHGIIEITAEERDDIVVRVISENKKEHGTSKTVGSIVRGFKIGVIRLGKNSKNNNLPIQIWQRNYYENIIRDEEAYVQV